MLDQVGLLDDSYFMYSEEVDLCLRIQQAGWQLYWVPQAVVTHHGGQSSKQVASKMFLQLYQSKVRYFRKHHGRLSTFGYKCILGLAAAVRIALSALAFLEPPKQRSHHTGLAQNYRQLLLALPRF